MTRYFVDTWFFIVTIDPTDTHAAAVRRLGQRLRTEWLITHDAVLTELLNWFADEGSLMRRRVAETARDVLREVDIVATDRPLFLKSLALYGARSDKEYSLVDCMSMVVMRERGITHVLTNDHHFRREGFIVVNE
jgi:uncharacterized protein